MLEALQLDDKYETIKKNRIVFIKKIFEGYDSDFLYKWYVRQNNNYCRLTNEFIEYICEKENFQDKKIEKVEIIKRFLRKNIEKKIKVSKKNQTKEYLGDIRYFNKIGEGRGMDYKCYDGQFRDIEFLPYNEWQEFKNLIILIKKHINNYVVEKQKKTICNLTDCYKEKILIRICELCGNTVEDDAVYCAQCGGELNEL